VSIKHTKYTKDRVSSKHTKHIKDRVSSKHTKHVKDKVSKHNPIILLCHLCAVSSHPFHFITKPCFCFPCVQFMTPIVKRSKVLKVKCLLFHN